MKTNDNDDDDDNKTITFGKSGILLGFGAINEQHNDTP